MISWTYIQPLPTNIGSFKGDVKLKVLKENLAEIHPVDLADIIEEDRSRPAGGGLCLARKRARVRYA